MISVRFGLIMRLGIQAGFLATVQTTKKLERIMRKVFS